jgi:fructose-bisphosphate aldolase class I
MNKVVLEETARALVAPGKGILAADESMPTIKKRFDKIGVESTAENHRIYRQLLFRTPGVEEFISGVILFDETIRQKTDENVPFAKYLTDRGIIPGIKVDQGKTEIPNSPGEMMTQGLDGLEGRLFEYRKMGAKFTKWRAVFKISDNTPTEVCVDLNADGLTEFALLSQKEGLVPIVEPEVLTDGTHGIAKSEEVTYRVLKRVFEKLSERQIYFEGMLLKPNWIHHGKDCSQKASNKEIAEKTLRVMKKAVPSEVPGLMFLSGGDSPKESTTHLDMMNEIDKVPWQLSFSFGRALQQSVLATWKGKSSNIKKAQKEFYKRAKLNSLARSGEYELSKE